MLCINNKNGVDFIPLIYFICFYIYLVYNLAISLNSHTVTMTSSTNQLDALGRIVTTVRQFRQAPENLHKGAYTPELSHYLQLHLSAQDWNLWQSLQLDWETSKAAC